MYDTPRRGSVRRINVVRSGSFSADEGLTSRRAKSRRCAYRLDSDEPRVSRRTVGGTADGARRHDPHARPGAASPAALEPLRVRAVGRGGGVPAGGANEAAGASSAGPAARRTCCGRAVRRGRAHTIRCRVNAQSSVQLYLLSTCVPVCDECALRTVDTAEKASS